MTSHRIPLRLLTGAAAGALGLTAALAGPAAAGSATFKVSTLEQLRTAVAQANANPGADTIQLKRNIAFTAESAEDLEITDTLTVNGTGKTIDAAGLNRVFDVTVGTKLTLSKVVLRNGAPEAGASGGAVRSAGTLVVSGSTIVDSTVEGTGASGGAIFNDGGTLVVKKSTLKGNSATRAGGAIEALAGKTTVTGSTLAENSTGPMPGNGGGLHLTGAGDVTVSSSKVTGNTASAEGGGLWNSGSGTFLVETSSITDNVALGNEATNGGGGLFNDGGDMIVRGSIIKNNSATGTSGSGGGILNDQGSLTVENTILLSNKAPRAGGAIETNVGTVNLRWVKMLKNSTGANPGNGGGLHTSGAGTVTYDGGLVLGNSAANEGGGLWNSAAGTMTVTNVFSGFNSSPVGPNVYTQPGGTFTFNGTVVPAGPNNL